MTEKKKRGRPRKQPIDSKEYVTVNGRKVSIGTKAGNNATTGNDNVAVGVTSDGSGADYYRRTFCTIHYRRRHEKKVVCKPQ